MIAPPMPIAQEAPLTPRRRGAGAITVLRELLRRPNGSIGVAILVIFSVFAIVPALFVGPLETVITADGPRLGPPSAEYPFGTDELGRSMLNLTVHATRISMVIGLLATLITVGVGVFVGILSGYVGGRFDAVAMRIADFFLVMPTFVLAIVLTAVIRDVVGSVSREIAGIRLSLLIIVVVIGLTSWSSTARIIRSQVLSLKERAFVDRARVIGASPGHIMLRHLLPNVTNLVVANAVLTFAGAILTETTLSFIGLGDPSQPSWGQLLEASQRASAPGLGAWWYFVPPGAAVVLVVFAFTLVGNALDEIMNPRRRARG
ncbi:MAG TPA: ABC transporter permease [Candidatus Binatia bacterium]|nr:ABC transporter permease [Candidatus Binatia bacterium]